MKLRKLTLCDKIPKCPFCNGCIYFSSIFYSPVNVLALSPNLKLKFYPSNSCKDKPQNEHPTGCWFVAATYTSINFFQFRLGKLTMAPPTSDTAYEGLHIYTVVQTYWPLYYNMTSGLIYVRLKPLFILFVGKYIKLVVDIILLFEYLQWKLICILFITMTCSRAYLYSTYSNKIIFWKVNYIRK